MSLVQKTSKLTTGRAARPGAILPCAPAPVYTVLFNMSHADTRAQLMSLQFLVVLSIMVLIYR
jgi:hypothetical protein